MGVTKLPSNYRLAREIDMRKDKKMAFWLNVAGTVLFFALCVVGYFIHPIDSTFDFKFIYIIVVIAGLLAYIILHELTHALFMRIFIHNRVNFGFHVYAAYAGMRDGYFRRLEYIIIALAPVVILGIALGLLNFFLPSGWFWTIFIIQGQNIAGAVGDYYVIYLLTKTSSKTLINDDGMSMRYYEVDPNKIEYEERKDDDFFDLQ